MKKKFIISLLIIMGIISFNIFTVNAADENIYGKEYTVGNTDMKFVIEKIQVQINEYQTQTYSYEDEYGSGEYSYDEIIPLQTIELDESQITINPVAKELKYGSAKKATFIDLNLDFNKEKMNQFIEEYISSNEEYEGKNLNINLEIKYHWTNLPANKEFYNANFLKAIRQDMINYIEESEAGNEEESEEPEKEVMKSSLENSGFEKFNLNDSITQIFNYATLEQIEEDDDSIVYDYEEVQGARIEDENLYFYDTLDKDDTSVLGALDYTLIGTPDKDYNAYQLFYDLDDYEIMGWNNDFEVVMFHDFDNIEVIENTEEKVIKNNKNNDIINKKVKVDNTAATCPIAIYIASLILFLAGGSLFVLGTKQFVRMK